MGNRRWCAKFKYPNKKECFFGSAWVRDKAPMHEIEAELRKVMLEYFPEGFDIIDCIPGMIVFIPEGE